MFMQLNPPIPLKTPKGKAWAMALIDYGPQWDLQWVTFLHDTGECWTFLNRDIRQEANLTFGLTQPTPFEDHSIINGYAANGNTPLNGHGRSIPHDYSERLKPAMNGHNGHAHS